MTIGNNRINLHASCVSLSGQGVLIMGPSGSGKSSLALQLMAYGCDLVSDDRTDIAAREGWLEASAPMAIQGYIEGRGIGLLKAEPVPHARVKLVVDMGKVEVERLPHPRCIRLLEIETPLVHRVESAHFPASILQYLKTGREA